MAMQETIDNDALLLKQFPLLLRENGFDWYCRLSGIANPHVDGDGEKFLEDQCPT